ncbi:hypothetical protein PHSC3_001339 [Chlamydiales bacterium STE3]|nr:hypothetical protein PHSC3_001339 [Chlamydiales bacterium STE3]
MTAGVDSSIRQQCPNNNSISPSKQKSIGERRHDLFRSTISGLTDIWNEIERYPKGSKEYKDGWRRFEALFDKFEVEVFRLSNETFDAVEKKIADVGWRARLMHLKPQFKWIKNLTDFSQITWGNVKALRQLKDFQGIIRYSEKEKLIKKTTGRFEKFKKTVDAYKPTFWQKIWQIVTLRFTFIKVNQIRKYLEKI